MTKFIEDPKNPNVVTIVLETEEEKQEMAEYAKLFCNCKEPSETPEYVTNHNGVNHGWICTKCDKFVQIG